MQKKVNFIGANAHAHKLNVVWGCCVFTTLQPLKRKVQPNIVNKLLAPSIT
jgi:hypothetical protein